MEYLVTIKANRNAPATAQRVETSTSALNLARRAILAIQPMEETSADLKAMQFINNIKAGYASVIENSNNGAVLIFQIHKG